MRRTIAFFALSLGLAACDPPPPDVPPQPVATVTPVSTTAPETSKDPAPVTDGDVTVAYTNGVQILVKRTPGAELSAMQLYIKGGTRDWTMADAGVSMLALGVATSGGTESLDKDAYFKKLSTLGSDLWSESTADYGAIKAKTLVSQWDETFTLLADTFLRPAMPPSELDVRRARQIAGLRHEQEDPDAILNFLVHSSVFKGHPFENRPIGTETSVSALTLDNLKVYLGKLRETNRLVFVTVGDVEPTHVVEKVKAAFGKLPAGSFASAPFPPLTFEKSTLSVTERKLDTNYIEGVFAMPSWTSPDLADGIVAISVLQYRLFQEVRTKRNLSYAPSASFDRSSSVTRGALYVTAVDPAATIKVMFDEVKKLQNELVSEKDLTATKSVYLTKFLMQNEATAGQADMFGMAQLLGGDWKLARVLPERIRAVTPDRVQAFAKKYLGRMQFTVLGDPTKIDKDLFTSM